MLRDYGKNVTPRYVKDVVRPDGKLSVVYGNRLSSSDRVGKPSGHGVKGSNGIDFSRTIGGCEASLAMAPS